ncbi:MAG: potassium channel protein [Deltaproteobacteria bacterium]|nr:potassium channel protein [Deltaproteobacteria bacterium]
MKFIYSSIVSSFLESKSNKQNIRLLVRFLLVVGGMVTLYSIVFHFLMAAEGREYSWITGFYWTLVVMTTLGFGDVTFTGDIGKAFSILVLLSGVVFLMVLFPFTFIKFFLAPWMAAETRRRTPAELPGETRDHILITSYDAVTATLIDKLKVYKQDYAVIVEDLDRATELYNRDVRVALGHIDDPETYRKMRIDQAALIVATNSDEINTNIAFTVRELNEKVPILTTADSPHSLDILSMAGSSRVLQLTDIMGRSFAGWTLGGDCRANIVGRFDELIIAEAPAIHTPLVGQSLIESNLRDRVGVTVVGVWERGRFDIPAPDRVINRNTVLIFAGTEEQIAAYNEVFSFYQMFKHAGDPVIIIGGGRVGKAISERLKEREIAHIIVEKNPRKVTGGDHYVLGDAADIDTLKKAWIEKAPAALITSHDDAANIYLTKYCRSLRPDMQIISRANQDRNVSTLHRAGADFVISYPSLGANAIFHFLMKKDILLMVEGLDIFQLPVPRRLVGLTLARSKIRRETGCTVVAFKNDGVLSINPDPHLPIREETEMFLIGTYEAERQFLRVFQSGPLRLETVL